MGQYVILTKKNGMRRRIANNGNSAAQNIIARTSKHNCAH